MTYFRAVKFIDENETEYGIKHTGNKPRVLATPFGFDASVGLITGVSVVRKFGYNYSVGTAYEDVWNQGGTYTYQSSASTMYVSSSDAGDTGTMTVEGLDTNWDEQTQSVTLSGQSQVEVGSGLTWIRVFRAFNTGGTEFAGDIYVAETDSLTGGVPDTDSKIKAKITSPEEQTKMALWSVPAGKTLYITSIYAGTRSKDKGLRFGLYVREFGKTFLDKRLLTAFNGHQHYAYDFPEVIAAKSDVKIRALSDIAGAECEGGFEGWYE